MANSSSNQDVTVNIGEEYPYPSYLLAASFTSVKLSDRDEYGVWKTQMLCLIEGHGMLGFIDGTLVSPQMSFDTHRLWRRSDAVVKGWILGSLSNQTLRYVLKRLTEKYNQERNVADFSAKDVWDELQTMYAPVVLPQLPVVIAGQRREVFRKLYYAILGGRWETVNRIIRDNGVTVIDKIMDNGNTALHVAVGTDSYLGIFKKLWDVIPETTQLLNLKNSEGSTLLHVAAIVGNTEAAKMLVERNRDLLLAKDNEGRTPLAIALSINKHTEMFKSLLNCINPDTNIKIKDALFSGPGGDELLVSAISSKDFGLALNLMRYYRTLHSDAALMAIAQNYPCELTVLEEFARTNKLPWRIKDVLERASVYTVGRCVPLCGSWGGRVISLIHRGIYCIMKLLLLVFKAIGWLFIKERIRTYNNARELFSNICDLIKASDEPSYHHLYYMNPIFEATRQNSSNVVALIIYHFSNAIFTVNEDGHNIIQYAVLNRSENIYNMIYQMSEHKNIYKTIKDSSGNNLLHLAARMAPSNKLNCIPGEAFQIQRELQWFKEVEGFVCPPNVIQKNSSNETPQMVFSREHKDLLIKAEKWMKKTAASYTITAALVTTVMFSAAIKVLGGYQNSGMSDFTDKMAFNIFASSDSISLFTAVTSLLIFLFMLTARFSGQDFLFSLPAKFILGMVSLHISTLAMFLAFYSTLYLAYGWKNMFITLVAEEVLFLIIIFFFVIRQSPLGIKLITATYGRIIFGKKRENLYY